MTKTAFNTASKTASKTRSKTASKTNSRAAPGPSPSARPASGTTTFDAQFTAAIPGWPASDAAPYRIDPARLIELQRSYAEEASGLMGSVIDGTPQAAPTDRRFANPAWAGLHASLAQLYLLNARFMGELAESVEADTKTKAKIRFAVQQWVDAMSPANYLVTNPEAQRKIIETQGESFAAGLANMMRDLQKGRISQTDESAFEVGRNVATSAGTVVYQNPIFQLIQFSPLGKTVYERPLLMVPPCINKYYILDLQPENSLVRHMVAAGHTVFLVSWRNPDEGQASLTWDDYIRDGVIEAIGVTSAISRHKTINALGFCVGGTLLSTALAVLAARGEEPVESLTLLTTLLDFSDTGVLDVFVDEAQVQMRERTIGGAAGVVGLMPARDLAASFSFLRPNDLVWNYVVSNYLKGEAPPPFDLLYWNADSTNLPGPFFAWYLRNTYLEDRLKEPGACEVDGTPIDLGRIKVPTFVYGSREDHIVPWQAAYASTQLLGGNTRFVLGASGHIAGVINPPAKGRRSHWSYPVGSKHLPADPADWIKGARELPGSWWPDWEAWLAPHAGKKVNAPRVAGDARHRPIEDAPGSYVRVRAV